VTGSLLKGRRAGTLLAGAVVVGLLASCSPSTTTDPASSPSPTVQRGGTLSLAVAVSPATTGWDPLVADPATQRVVGPAVMATLMRPDPQGGAPTPWLAESATSDAAARTWTITLREGLLFSNGATLTAADVVFLFEQAAADPTLSTRFGTDANGPWFSRAVARDPRTVVLSLRRGNAALDRLVLAAPEFGCIQAGYGGLDREAYFAGPPACGPFLIAGSSDMAAKTVGLVRNPQYYAADEVLLDGVTIDAGVRAQQNADLALDASRGDPRRARTIAPTTQATVTGPPTSPSPETAVSKTAEPTATATDDGPTASPSSNASGTPDGTVTATPPVTPEPERWASDEVVLSPLGATTAIVFRNAAPTSDANVRQALRACIDYAAAAAASPGSAVPAAGLTPNGWSGAIAVPPPEQRLDIARLAIDLIPQDSRTIELTFRGSDAVQTDRATAIAAEAARAGLTIDLRPRSAASLERVLQSGRFQAALVAIEPTVAHTAEVSRLWAFTGGFGGRWSPTPGRVAYPIQITRPQEPDRAAAGTARFEDVVRRGAWVIPVAIDPHRAGARDGVEGVAVGPEGSLALDRIWLSSAVR
jgi:ABC-type transport system substrate-binding protein